VSHAGWRSSALPAVHLPAALAPEAVLALRAELAHAARARETRIDRASHELVALASPELEAAIEARAVEVTGRRVRVASCRVLRFGPGDYALTRADHVAEVAEGEPPPVEVIVDLSASPVPGAEVHYRHRGRVFFVVPTAPGGISLVERGPTVLANHTYVSRLHEAAEVVRVVALLREG